MHILLSSLLLMFSPVDSDVGITTKSGEIVQGVLASSIISMDTTFGKASLESDAIVSIEFGEDDVVAAKGDSILRGTLKLDAVTIRTANGSKTISRDELKSLHASQHATLRAGEITDGVHWNASTYHLRAPKNFDPKKTYPAIVFLHGIPSNSSMFIRAICAVWPEIGERYILIGINGTMVHETSTEDVPRYFYTFVEFAGNSTYDPVPGAERQSPLLVAEVVADLKKRLPVSKVIVSGHSMGGYMTYSTFMNYPELFDGAMPSAGAMTKFAQVGAYDDEKLRAKQRAIPVAIVHATNDDVVLFKFAREAIEAMKVARFRNVKLFQNDTAAHNFVQLPYPEALRWLEGVMGLTSN